MTVKELFANYTVFRSIRFESKSMYAIENELIKDLAEEFISNRNNREKILLLQDNEIKCFIVSKTIDNDFSFSNHKVPFRISDLKALMLVETGNSGQIRDDTFLDFFN